MARVKLEEAEFFLGRLESSTATSQEFRYFLTAFLQSCMSVPEWLLYEYAEKYLDLSQDDYIDERGFELAAKTAKARSDGRGSDFLDWWRKEIGKLRNSLEGKVLLRKRNVVVHRGAPAFTIHLMIAQPVEPYFRFIGSVVTALAGSPKGTSLTFEEQSQTAPKTISWPQQSTEMFFQDYPKASVKSLCRTYFNTLESYVEKGYATFK